MKRQITITLAGPSTAELIPNACKAIEPATMPLKTPTAPSIVIQTRLTQESRRARRALRCQSALRTADDDAGMQIRAYAGVHELEA